VTLERAASQQLLACPLERSGDMTTEDSPLPPILTVDEVAELLRLDRKSIYAAIRRGEIPGVRRIGRTVRLHRATVLEWLAQGQGRAPRLKG
jgi:excisionase family DNA binding protein